MIKIKKYSKITIESHEDYIAPTDNSMFTQGS